MADFNQTIRATFSDTARAFDQAIRATFSDTARAFDQTIRATFSDTARAFDQAIRATFGDTARAFDQAIRATFGDTARAFDQAIRAALGNSLQRLGDFCGAGARFSGQVLVGSRHSEGIGSQDRQGQGKQGAFHDLGAPRVGRESGYEANATPRGTREKFIRVMVTIDRIDRPLPGLYSAVFGVTDSYFPVAFHARPATEPGPIAEAEPRKNFAIMDATDKTPRVFISPRY